MGKLISKPRASCAFCGKQIIGRYSNAKYCADACKTRASEVRKKAAPRKVNMSSYIYGRIRAEIETVGYIEPAKQIMRFPDFWGTSQLDRRCREMFANNGELDRERKGKYARYFFRR